MGIAYTYLYDGPGHFGFLVDLLLFSILTVAVYQVVKCNLKVVASVLFWRDTVQLRGRPKASETALSMKVGIGTRLTTSGMVTLLKMSQWIICSQVLRVSSSLRMQFTD